MINFYPELTLKRQSGKTVADLMQSEQLQEVVTTLREKLPLKPQTQSTQTHKPSNAQRDAKSHPAVSSAQQSANLQNTDLTKSSNAAPDSITPKAVLLQKKNAAYFEPKNKPAAVNAAAFAAGPAAKPLVVINEPQMQGIKEALSKWSPEQLLAAANNPNAPANALNDIFYFVSACKNELSGKNAFMIYKALSNNPKTSAQLRKKIFAHCQF